MCSVPFPDTDFIDAAMSVPPELKMHTHTAETSAEGAIGSKRIEKHILRAAFDTPDDPYLPASVLWRQKEQFSDGVG